MTREQKKEFLRRVRKIHRDTHHKLLGTARATAHSLSPPKKRKPSPLAVEAVESAQQQCSKAAEPAKPVSLETFGTMRALLHPKLLVCGPKSKRLQLLSKQIIERGATVQPSAAAATHVFLHRTVTQVVLRGMVPESSSVHLRTIEWLETSLAANQCVPLSASHIWRPFVPSDANRTCFQSPSSPNDLLLLLQTRTTLRADQHANPPNEQP